MLQAARVRGHVDFGVITIREDEFNAVLKRFPPRHQVSGRRPYVISTVPFPDGKAYVVAIVRCPEQGTSCAQAVAADLIEDFDPRWLAVVGIAGAAPSREYSLGDVVVATRVADFRVEAVLSSGERTYDVRGAPCHRDVTEFVALLPALQRIQDSGAAAHPLLSWNTPESIGRTRPPIGHADHLFYGDEESWRNEVKEGLLHRFNGAAPGQSLPLFTAGTIASSDRLIKDDEILATWKGFSRSTLAVEMEMAGVMEAARHHTKTYPVLGVRGISDVVGYKRDHQWTLYACDTAAAFFHALVRSRPFEPQATLPTLQEARFTEWLRSALGKKRWAGSLVAVAGLVSVAALPLLRAERQILIAPEDTQGLMDVADQPKQWIFQMEFQSKAGAPITTPLPRDGLLIGNGSMSPTLLQRARAFRSQQDLPEAFAPFTISPVAEEAGDKPTVRAVLHQYDSDKKSFVPCTRKELRIQLEAKDDTFWSFNIDDYCS